MLKKEIKYTNFDGMECVETAYFNLNKLEMAKLYQSEEFKKYGYLLEKGKKGEIFMNGDLKEDKGKKDEYAELDLSSIIEIIELFIAKSYGKKSDDGKRFIKNEQLLTEFKETDAYIEFIEELLTNPESVNEFITCIFPAKVMEELKNNPEYQKAIAALK